LPNTCLLSARSSSSSSSSSPCSKKHKTITTRITVTAAASEDSTSLPHAPQTTVRKPTTRHLTSHTARFGQTNVVSINAATTSEDYTSQCNGSPITTTTEVEPRTRDENTTTEVDRHTISTNQSNRTCSARRAEGTQQHDQ
jgi:hypothetical protein